MSGKLRGFFDILTGFFLGAGSLKIYYETVGAEENRESFIFRQNKRKIHEICTSYDNLKFGKGERVINSHAIKMVQEEIPEMSQAILKFGAPQRSPEILHYKNHVLAYDYARKVPLWVAEHLTKEVTNNSREKIADRAKSSFRPDPSIPEIFQAKNEDYLKSGWTRGHMAPAGDNKCDQESMNETFLLSNILPQDYENNANFWYRVEVFCRNLTKQFGDVYVISGPLWLPYKRNGKKFVKHEVIGDNNVAVPTHLFKVILAIDNNNLPFIGAFEVPNEPIPCGKKLSDFQVPLEKLERDSGFNYFKAIDQSKVQNLCEMTGCQLISKEVMENIAISRQLNNAETLEKLREIWQEISNKGKSKDQYIVSAYRRKLKELDKKQSTANNIVDVKSVVR